MAQFQTLGDRAVVVDFGDRIDEPTFVCVQAFSQRLERTALLGMIEYVPAYTSVTIYYDPLVVSLPQFCAAIEQVLSDAEPAPPAAARMVETPVCYGGEYGLDLEFVARHNKLTIGEVVARCASQIQGDALTAHDQRCHVVALLSLF